jgi:putative intracellular protease/amidase
MKRWRLALCVLLAGLAVPVAVGVTGMIIAADGVFTPREATAPAAPPAPAAAPDPQKPTAVVVMSNEGANAADALAPYEVLAATGSFNLYTATPDQRPVPLTGGLDLVPDLTLAELDRLLPNGADVVVVPELPDAGETTSAPLEQWLATRRATGDALLVGVCTGTEVLASAGLLDGRPATTHWLAINWFSVKYPDVLWQHGARYVDDGDLITTAGVLSGVDGALRVVERLLGTDAALRAARSVGWAGYSPGAPATVSSRLEPGDEVVALNGGYRWDRAQMGVLLTDGAGEIELASAFRPYTTFSYVARPIAVTADGHAVRSRHGLTFVPRAALSTVAHDLDRLVVPGADAARRDLADGIRLSGGVAPEYLHGGSGFAFEGALRDIARSYDVATARWVGKTLEYPTAGLTLTGPGWPWELALRAVGIAVAATVIALVAIRLIGRARRVPETSALRPAGRFVRHYLEMVVAMLVGMGVLGLLWNVVWPGLSASEGLHAAAMVTDMCIGMSVWMRIRRHSWPAMGEMCAAMAAPFLVLAVPYATGALSADAMAMGAHVLMLPAMALAMLRRRDEYTASVRGVQRLDDDRAVGFAGEEVSR